VPLPSFHGQWLPDRVELDGHSAPGLFRHANQLWMQVEPGDHGVILSGRLPDLPSFTLPLLLKPKQIAVVGSSWQVSGIQDNGQIESQLQFDRINQSQRQGDGKQLASGTLPPFVRVQRSLQLNLDWRVVTTVERLSPADIAIVLKIPLLRGEKVTTPGITVKDQQVEMNLPAQQGVLSWESSLDKSGQIELNAANTSQWIEVWQADISPIWHLSSQGIPVMRLNADAGWLPEWHPWPGESLNLKITRPRPVVGQVATIDNSRLLIKPGKRITAAELNFNLRSSQGMQHTLTLPDSAVVQALTVNGQSLPPRQEGGKITLPVNPGEQQVSLSWQQPEGIGMVTRTPSVDLGLPSVNSKLGIELGRDRWVLLVWGPKLGPAVLFWGVIVVIVIVSAGLGKIPLTPLKSWQWFLLLLGLSQMPLEAGSLVVAWLMLLGWRGSHPPTLRRYFNLFQILLGLLTLAALAVLLITVQQGLLGGSPDMQISGNQSNAHTLNWYQDRANTDLPQAMAVSVPVLAYRLVMLAWAFWLAASLLDWLKWGWRCFAEDGFWRKKPPVGDVPKTP
jgi:hypothetical protein